MIELQVPEDNPIETALLGWFRSADLYRDGELVRKGVNLLGSNEPIAKRYAKAIRGHLAAGTDREKLTVHKRHGVGDPGAQWVTCTLRDLVAMLTGTRPPADRARPAQEK